MDMVFHHMMTSHHMVDLHYFQNNLVWYDHMMDPRHIEFLLTILLPLDVILF